MRTIKFKCWDKKLSKWVDIFTHKIGVQLTDVGFAVSTGYDSENNPTWDFNKVEFDRYEFPQFTGLLDRQGKEIYEGDVIKHPICEQGIVIWFQSYTSFKVEKGEFLYDLNENGGCEVIGNIYENKSLLDE